MRGYARYERIVVDWAGDYMRPFYEAKKRGEQVPEKDNSFFQKIFYGFTEISGAVDALKLAEIFILLAPPRTRRIKRDDYLKYHINAYLQEVYILEARLKAYATKLKRAYSKTDRHITLVQNIDPLFELVKDTFEGIVNTRGRHVHLYRYSDDDLDRLSSLILISRFKDEFLYDAKFEYKLMQLTWKKRVKENNDATLKLLDYYFDAMYEAVTEDGNIVVPDTALHAD
jgi:hypothetical protein